MYITRVQQSDLDSIDRVIVPGDVFARTYGHGNHTHLIGPYLMLSMTTKRKNSDNMVYTRCTYLSSVGLHDSELYLNDFVVCSASQEDDQ
jgi:hypothetical protein